MSRNQRLAERRQFALDDVKVGAADAAGEHPQQELTRARLGLGQVLHAQRPVRNSTRRVEHRSFHTALFMRRTSCKSGHGLQVLPSLVAQRTSYAVMGFRSREAGLAEGALDEA